jgi:hypothetical protein
MYFISLVRYPMIEYPLMSVRNPGIVLGNKRIKFKATNFAGGVRNH